MIKFLSPKAFVELLQKETTRRVVPVDSTWYMPNANRSGKQEFLNLDRIPNSVFFDIDAVKDKSSPYPHMLPDLKTFNQSMSELGLQRNDVLVVYDRIGNFSAPRCAWTLSILGHPSVYLLNNYNLYKQAKYPLETTKRTKDSELPSTNYKSNVDLRGEKVINYDDMLRLVQRSDLAQRFNVYDARSLGRFEGSAPEPRPGLPSGHIAGAQPLPFVEVLEPDSGAFPESTEDMKRKLDEAITKLKSHYNPQLPTIAMCGTGVSGCIILAALEHAGIKDIKLYDGSWTEWVMRSDPTLIAKDRESLLKVNMESLPGLSDGNAVAVEDSNESHQLSIPRGSEWKVERNSEERLTVMIKAGIAEIFGTELANGIDYEFRDFHFSVYAVEDVTLEWKCPEMSSHNLTVVPNTTSRWVYNLHFALEKMRCSSFEGPRAIVIGEAGSGKTSLCRTLCSYAIKYKPYQPMFINLNPQDGIFSPPGCISAVPISDILDVQCSTWGQSMTSGATPLHSKQPFVKNFGLERITENKSLYKKMISDLASVVDERLAGDSLVRRSGCVIDTPPLSHLDEENHDLEEIMKQFKVNVVVAIGDDSEAIYEKYAQTLFPHVGSNFVRLPKLSGCIPTGDVYKRLLQRSAMREYFYGTSKTVLSPYAIGVDFGEVTVWKPRNVLDLTETVDPNQTESDMLPVEVTASNLQHALVAITYTDRKSSPIDVEHAPILGFALVTEVNEKRGKLRILLPVPGRQPSKAIILTSYRYLE